jgi:HAD superfamily hydrolase (TIGR01509 family)
MMERKNRYYLELIRNITPDDLLPGAQDLLDEVCGAGLKSALGSASKNAREVVDRLGIGHSFDAISDGYSVERQKPAPDLFVHASGQLNLPPRECVVFEDAAAGIEAARVGGFHSVGLGPMERVGGADAIFPSLEGIHLQMVLQALGMHPPMPAS